MVSDKIESLKGALLSAVVAALVAWAAKEYQVYAQQYPEVVNVLAIVAAALWNRFRQ